MSHLFVCTNCDCVDQVELAFAGRLPKDPADQLCTFCKTGTWHDHFARMQYVPGEDNVINRPTNLGLG